MSYRSILTPLSHNNWLDDEVMEDSLGVWIFYQFKKEYHKKHNTVHILLSTHTHTYMWLELDHIKHT